MQIYSIKILSIFNFPTSEIASRIPRFSSHGNNLFIPASKISVYQLFWNLSVGCALFPDIEKSSILKKIGYILLCAKGKIFRFFKNIFFFNLFIFFFIFIFIFFFLQNIGSYFLLPLIWYENSKQEKKKDDVLSWGNVLYPFFIDLHGKVK